MEPTRAIFGRPGSRELTCVVVSVIPAEDGRVEVFAAEDDPRVHEADAAPLPPELDLDGLVNRAAPVWDDVSIVGREATGGAFDFTITGSAIPGAVIYRAEQSPVLDPPQWEAAGSAALPSFDGPQGVTTDLLLRVSAVGQILAGPWAYYRVTLSDAVDGTVTAMKET